MTTARQNSIAAVDGGTYYHHATIHDPRWAHLIDRVIYAPDLADADLSDVDVLWVNARQDASLMVKAKDNIQRFLEQGKTVAAMGESHAEQWMPGTEWTQREVNFWWWLTPGTDSGLRQAAPEHPLWQHITLADATWHQHGYYTLPEGAVSLVEHASGGSILYEDRVSTPGRMLLTTLDPCYHHGSYFMPSTTRFLTGFVPWLKTLAD